MKLVCELSPEVLEKFDLLGKNKLENLKHQLEQFISHDNNYIILPSDFGDIKLYDLENPEKEVMIIVKEDS